MPHRFRMPCESGAEEFLRPLLVAVVLHPLIEGRVQLRGDHAGFRVGNQALVPKSENVVRLRPPGARISLDAGRERRKSLLIPAPRPVHEPGHNRVILAVRAGPQTSLEVRIATAVARPGEGLARLAERERKNDQDKATPRSVVGLVHDRDVVGRDEEAVGGGEGEVVPEDVARFDEGNVGDLFDGGDI